MLRLLHLRTSCASPVEGEVEHSVISELCQQLLEQPPDATATTSTL